MPKSKKAASSSSDSDSGPEDRNPPSKKTKPAAKDAKKSRDRDEGPREGGAQEGEPEWVLERLRLVRISEFRGRKFVDIREHYEKDGKILPGKKGIALNGIQWRKLLQHADEITKAIEQ